MCSNTTDMEPVTSWATMSGVDCGLAVLSRDSRVLMCFGSSSVTRPREGKRLLVVGLCVAVLEA